MKQSYVKTVIFVSKQKTLKSSPLIKMNGSEEARTTQNSTIKTNLKNKGKEKVGQIKNQGKNTPMKIQDNNLSS